MSGGSDRGRIVVAGGTGFIGRALTAELRSAGYEVVAISRTAGEGRTTWEQAGGVLEGAAGVVNLVGERIDQPWTPEARRRILESRVGSIRRLADLMRPLANRPPVWVQASAVGYYGDRGSEDLDESAAPGPEGHFLVDTCRAWEDAFVQALPAGMRGHRIRIGVVLGRDGGALPVLAKLARAFLGGAVGDGRQAMPWIHVHDLARLFAFAVANPDAPAVMNGTSPSPAANAEFMAAVRRAVGRPWSPPAPAPALHLVGRLGGPPPALVLEGQRALPRAAVTAGFEFRHPDLDAALADLLR